MMTPSEFRNEPLTDFASDAGRREMQAALRTVGAELGREFPLLIDGQAIRTDKTFRSVNPSQTDQVVAVLPQAGPEHERIGPLGALHFAKWFGAAAWLAARISHDTAQLTAELSGEKVGIGSISFIMIKTSK